MSRRRRRVEWDPEQRWLPMSELPGLMREAERQGTRARAGGVPVGAVYLSTRIRRKKGTMKLYYRLRVRWAANEVSRAYELPLETADWRRAVRRAAYISRSLLRLGVPLLGNLDEFYLR